MSYPPQSTNSNFFNGAHDFSMTNVQFTEVVGFKYSPVPSLLPPLPPLKHSSTFFVGRDEYLQRMKDYFSSYADGQRKSFLLYGLGGIGKTQICLRFLEQNSDLFSNIHWLDATSEATIELGLMQIAQAKNAPKEVLHSPGSVLQWISQVPKWLIIYDNADGDYSVVEKFLPPGVAGNILITSRNGELKRLVLGSSNVLAMEEDEAVALFLRSAMLDGTSDDVRNVAKKMVLELGGIPLALDQAGAYIHKSGCGINDYLKLYQKNKQKLMSKKEFKGASGYGRSAYGTWDISFQKIQQMTLNKNAEEAEAAQNAIGLLRIFAFLNHENIPEELFENAAENYMNGNVDTADSDFPMTLLNHQTLFIDEVGEWDRIQFLDGIQVLLSFSLISVANHLYSMHLARALLSCSIVPDWKIDNHAFCRLLAPQIRSNLLHGQELRLQEKYYGHEYVRFSIVFDHIGSWNEAEKILNAEVSEKKAMLGSDHADMLAIMKNLAFVYLNQGRWKEAEKLQIEVMNARKVMLGSDHPATLSTMSDLALTYRDQGRWDEAEKLQVEVMKAWKVTLGSHHPDTLTTINNLASTYQNQGRLGEAEKLQVEVMKAQKVQLGSDHPVTLSTLSNLALTYQMQGRWDEAENLQVEVMSAQKVKLGSDHPSTLAIMGNLGLTYQKQGRWQEAENLQLEVMKAWKVQLGSDHPHTLTAMNNLALSYCNRGRQDEAAKLLVAVMKARKVKLGSDHPNTLTSMNNLASMHMKQGRWDEAEKLQVEVINKWKVNLGSDHPTTLITMKNLALTYHNQGRWDEAEKLQIEVVHARKVKLGSEHPDTLQVMADLALTYKSQERLNEAEALLSHAVQTMQQVMGPEHHTTHSYKQELDKLLKAKQKKIS
ncbi:hypothetical protein F5887DRAFT_1184375 [Amanita rubescens]|nr:hypothetical protein F5887DRAFT_1184375 [Amanita rubescens]